MTHPKPYTRACRIITPKTQPILQLFRRKELVVVVDGTHSAAEVQQDLRRQLVQKSERAVGH